MISAFEVQGQTRLAAITLAAQRNARGLLASAILALATFGIASASGLPIMLIALLFGLAAQPFLSSQSYAPGLKFAAKTLLRIGVALLGAGVVASEIAALGLPVLALCVACVAFTIAIGCLTSKLLRSDTSSGLLFGGAVAICGASAALAISAALPQSRENETRTLLAVLGVTALSTIAMVAYPLLASALAFDDKMAGIFFGAAIHDVAQVVGAGYMVSDKAGETATMVKLVRVACLVPVVAIIAFTIRSANSFKASSQEVVRPPLLPTFLIGFIGLSVIASSGVVAPAVLEGLALSGKALLVVAIVALGCLTSLDSIWRIGWKPVALLIIPTLALAIFVLLVLSLRPQYF